MINDEGSAASIEISAVRGLEKVEMSYADIMETALSAFKIGQTTYCGDMEFRFVDEEAM